MTGFYVFLFCVIIILGAALPLLRKTKLPDPPKGGWKKISDKDEEKDN